MSGPKRLWAGDWMAESEAARARMAEQRTLAVETGDAPVAPVSAAPPARRPPATWRSLLARASAAVRTGRFASRGLRARLVAIALLSGAVGAGAMVAVEAATGQDRPAAPAPAGARPYLGVQLAPAPAQAGALVVLVIPGSPADTAGVMIGDVITSIDGRAVSGPDAAVADIGALRPGSAAVLGIDRFGQPLTLSVTVGSRRAGGP